MVSMSNRTHWDKQIQYAYTWVWANDLCILGKRRFLEEIPIIMSKIWESRVWDINYLNKQGINTTKPEPRLKQWQPGLKAELSSHNLALICQLKALCHLSGAGQRRRAVTFAGNTVAFLPSTFTWLQGVDSITHSFYSSGHKVWEFCPQNCNVRHYLNENQMLVK